ncbi:NUDIX hydrolase [Pseudomonas sp. PLMAX]|jgi:ADP-ribose pyrophosphatase|uniref:NUDIX hydrolase n=1 Tax=Pseudomonas sp. PLMAX TaxID=2201998 RepID=UPI0038B87221
MNAPTQAFETLLETPFFDVIKRGKYFIVKEEHEVNAAVILARNTQGQYLLVDHYRGAIDQDSLELPRGGRKPNETLLETAKRELLEETGYASESWALLGKVHTNTSLIGSSVEVYLAVDAVQVTTTTDGETKGTEAFTGDELKALIRGGKITDSHTLSAWAML